MRSVTLLQPERLTFGTGCLTECVDYLSGLTGARIHILASHSSSRVAEQVAAQLRERGCLVTLDATVTGEPTVAVFYAALGRAREGVPSCVFGLGGGSTLDLAKLVAAFVSSNQRVEETFGSGLVLGRGCHLVCAPTTAGTGSEVSPNAILLDETRALKMGVVSRWLVPDATFIDPALSLTVPAAVTAYTGLDALTHCVEAYTNRFAHPLVDGFALHGIGLAAEHLEAAVKDGANLAAREGMALASLYGGLCLGPVNTAAVHALAYPLGGRFHVPHGLANALLLPAVFRFNSVADVGRHAEVAEALGVVRSDDKAAMCAAGAEQLERLVERCGLDRDLSGYGVDHRVIPEMAAAALTVTRLLKNNPRTLTRQDAERLYTVSLGGGGERLARAG